MIKKRVMDVPYAAPRAVFLKMLRKKPRRLEELGISKKTMKAALKTIEFNSKDSEIILKICIPPTETILNS
tara:strand:- start:1998 stop:2210 length:213 start_codon:yes stop_codon:yes gene_type:complete